MVRSGVIVTGIIGIVLVIGAVVVLGNKKDDTADQNTAASTATSQDQPSSTNSSNTTNQTEAATATITYNGSLFSPSQVTVKKGDTIIVKNGSSTTVDFESDDHPIHTDNPEINTGEIAPGQSKSFKANRTGSWVTTII